jgi:hypothetical protein
VVEEDVVVAAVLVVDTTIQLNQDPTQRLALPVAGAALRTRTPWICQEMVVSEEEQGYPVVAVTGEEE